MMRIDIMDLQKEVRIDKELVTGYAKAALEAMGEEDSELSVLFVNDAYMKRLNWKYRKVNSKTDVLAFSMREGEGVSDRSPILGDVVISVETAKKEAMIRKRPFQREICLYLVHGILHLLGYDDARRADRVKMRAKEKEILARFCV